MAKEPWRDETYRDTGARHYIDRVAGRIYNRGLALVLGGAAFVVLVTGLFFIRAGGVVFGMLWMAGGLGFALTGRWLWRSRTTLSETFDGHG
jgi:hypothetical protein